MQIDLHKIPVFVITTGNAERAAFVGAELDRVGLTPRWVKGVTCSPGIIGCALSHLKILRSAPAGPFLILEDDCAVGENFSPVLDVPESDVAYLGVSTWGIQFGLHGVARATRATTFAEGWLQVHNMCSTHAMLYRGEPFKRAAIETIVECLTHNIAFDVGFAELQKHFVAVTPTKPLFYQAACIGGHEDATRQALVPIPFTKGA